MRTTGSGGDYWPHTDEPAQGTPGYGFQHAPTAAAPGQHAGTGEPAHLAWVGSPWDLTGLSFINLMLNIVTLGIYSFWGKTEVRKKVWSSVRLQGEPLTYTGTGKELFLGFLFALAVVFLPLLIVALISAFVLGPNPAAELVINLIFYIVIFLFWGVAIYRARRYRLTRTLWRGIRGGMNGSPGSFAWLWIWSGVLVPLTLGWISPYRQNELQRRLTSETTFGTLPFRYEGGAGPLYGPFAGMWIGGLLLYALFIGGVIAIVGKGLMADVAAGQMPDLTPGQVFGILGLGVGMFVLWVLVSVFYQAYKLNLFARYSSFDGARFSMRITALGLIGLFLSNLGIYMLTLGILSPVIQARTAKFFVDRLSLDGSIDFARIAQSQAALGGAGEGLAQAFDVDAF